MIQTSMSPTLAVNEAIRRQRRSGRAVLNLAFGEAGLPVHSLLREALAAGASENSYGPVAGTAEVRESIAGYFSRRNLATHPDQVLAAPGSKALLYALMLALPGDIVLPQPSWVSYQPQADLVGKRVVRVPISTDVGGIPDPDQLLPRLRAARAEGLDPQVLIITNPDNPTGTVGSLEAITAVGEVVRSEGLMVVADEIYRDLAYEPKAFRSCAEILPDVTFVTGGLSKSLALGGWRVGMLRTPDNDAGRRAYEEIKAIGSEIWSALPSPVDVAARIGFSEPPELLEYVTLSRRLHEQTTGAVFKVVTDCGLRCRRPSAAFYLYPDFTPVRRCLREGQGVTSAQQLQQKLLDDHDIGVLSGQAFGDPSSSLCVRLSVSLLYGESDADRWEALQAAKCGEILDLPRMRSSLAQIRDAFYQVTGTDQRLNEQA